MTERYTIGPMGTDENEDQTAMHRRIPWRAIGLLAVIIAVFVVGLVYRDQFEPALFWLEQRIEALGPWGPLAYVLIYILWSLAGLPGSLITIAGGSIFQSQPVIALVSVSLGSTLGAGACFLIARRFARESMRSWVMQRAAFAKLDQATQTHGVLVVAITRLVPIFPFNLLNYGFGLTRVGFWKYLVVSWVCMLPATAMVVFGVGGLLGAIREGKISWGLAVGFGLALIVMLAAAALAKRSWSRMRGHVKDQTDRLDNSTRSTATDRRRDPGLE